MTFITKINIKISLKLEKDWMDNLWRAVQKLSKKLTGEEGGRYKTETQCLTVVSAEVTDRAMNSKS